MGGGATVWTARKTVSHRCDLCFSFDALSCDSPRVIVGFDHGAPSVLAPDFVESSGPLAHAAEADRMGLRKIVVPAAGYSPDMARGITGRVLPVSHINEALRAVLGGSGQRMKGRGADDIEGDEGA